MKIQHFMALVVLSLPTVPGARAAVRGFKARTRVPGLLTLACLLALPATAQVNYAVSGDQAYVAYSPNASGDVVIASTYLGYPVTGVSGFSGATNLTSVTIPNGVGWTGQEAFRGCTSLRSVTIPGSLNRIELATFYGCTSLISVSIGNGVGHIFELAFQNCTSLTNVTIPDSVTYVGGRAFGDCTSLTSVTIGNGASYIWYDAFVGSTSLTNFSVAAANPAYRSLDGVLFNKAQTTLFLFPLGRAGSYAIPDSVTSIAHHAFSRCTSLTSVTIPNSVTSIEYLAFSGSSLTSVTIGNGVTSIGVGAFSGSISLTNLSVAAANPVYSSLDGVFFNKAQTTLIIFPPGRGGSYVIPNSVTSIGGSAFSGCPSLTSVTLGNSVTNTGVSAFSGCTSLTNVTIPNNVTGIGNASFFGCTSLTRVTIPNSVTRIGFEAFMRCTNLASVTFLGNAPVLVPYPTNSFGHWFTNVGAGAKAYYYCGTTGWGTSYGTLPTVMLCPPQIAPGSAGVKPGGFGFTLTRLTNQTIVVEASTNLVNWQPIWTNPPPGASANFVDPEWLQHPNRFYRARAD